MLSTPPTQRSRISPTWSRERVVRRSRAAWLPRLVITAGVPFGTPGATNGICVVKILTEAKTAA